MRALLDTHIWLWYLIGDERLTESHRSMIEAPENEIWLSPVSLWEAHLLLERGRIPVAEPPARWLKRALQVLRLKQAPLTFPIALQSRSIRLEHADPADRFLAATAIELKLTLLTADVRLLRCPDLTTG
jgi:PIN domain nuclease of toxin-antitoxin system